MVITNRRDFCALAALGVLSLVDGTRSRRSPALRIGVLAASSSTDFRVRGALDGIVLGVDEASRTAMLFRADFDLLQVDVPDDADPVAAAASLLEQGAQVLVSTMDEARSAGIAQLAAGRGSFVVHLVAPPPAASDGAPAISSGAYIAPRSSARAEAVRSALQAAGIDPGGVSDEARGVVVIDTDDPQAAAALLEANPGPPPETPVDGKWIVDLSGVTERLPLAPLPRHLVRADAWLPTLRRFGAAQLNDRFRARYGRRAAMRGPAWAGWFAMKALVETALRARAEDGETLRRALLAARFDGHKGTPLSFTPEGVLTHPLYVTGITPS